MRRLWSGIIAMCCLASANASHAIELKWYGGGADISVSSATRCTLVVQADSIEARLPVQWRLLWCADSSGIQFVAPDSAEACAIEEAQVSAIAGPLTRADSVANQSTAYFCSDGDPLATTAFQVVDLPAGGQGKLKVVAIDPNDPDSLRVIQSNEARFNGGVEGNFPLVILRAMSVHQSIQLQVRGIGVGLNDVVEMSLSAPDSFWTLPLQISSQSHGLVFGTDTVAALLPACELVVQSSVGVASVAQLAADSEPAGTPLGGCSSEFHEGLLSPPPSPLGYTIQPKDFAFARGFTNTPGNRFALHLFYIRHNYWYYQPPNDRDQWQPELDEKNLGHIWTYSFNTWEGPGGSNLPDTSAVTTVGRTGKFDDFHVWAPHIVQRGPYFFMFYTGVRSESGMEHQRIGMATSTDLVNWTQGEDPVLTAPDVPWVKKDLTETDFNGSQQMRDAFVMADPVNPGHWLMYFVAVDSLTSPRMAVGVARSSGNFSQWIADENPIRRTQDPTAAGTTSVVESPHVFRRHGQWWIPYTVNQDKVNFITSTEADPADTVAAHWSAPVGLRGVVEGEPLALQYWHATEYLQVNSKEYLAAFNDNNISIQISGILEAENPVTDSLLLACPEVASAEPTPPKDHEVRLSAPGHRPADSEVKFRLELPVRMAVRLAVYDVTGRRRTTVVDRELPGGSSEVIWNSRDASGARMPAGVYFAKLATPMSAPVTKVVLIR